MRVRAIAARDPRCNAVGTLEIECTPAGLVLTHVGMSAFSEGYAPSVPTERTELCVPWGNVQIAAIEGDQLFLSIDRHLSPLNRVVLRNFESGTPVDHRELYRRRLLVRVAVVAALLITLPLAWAMASRVSDNGPALLALFLSGGAALLVLVLGFTADRWLLGERAASLRDRSAFFADLAMYLPTITQQETRPEAPLVTLQRLGDHLIPRSTTAIVIALSASGLASLLTEKWLSERTERAERAAAEQTQPAAQRPASVHDEDDDSPNPPAAAPIEAPAPAPDKSAQKTPAAPAKPALAAPTLTAVPKSGACHCDRPESILWRGALPRLSPILIEQNQSTTHNGHPHLELELGVVNNSNQDINDLTMNLQFYEDERGAKPKRIAKKSHALYFEGPLRPGHAIKWAVDGRGTSFEVDNPYHETLALDATDAAPAAAFEELLSTANHRPIRLHGAMMLAALGLTQPARKGALALREALREEEGPYLDRLVSATGPIAVCQLAASESGTTRDVQACVQNNSTQPKANVTLRVRALDRLFDHRNPIAPPPIVISEETSRIPQPLPPGSGTFFSFHLDTTNPDALTPETFEVLVVDNDE